ncbi:MAG TPA: amidase [Bacilli bacterium]|nr:amidase [Bacilli bacterium]
MKKIISKVLFTLFFLFVATYWVVATKAPIDVTQMSIIDLQKALNQGYVTSEQLVNLYLERIAAYDEQFNTINQINKDALKQAKTLDQERASGKIRGDLHGIPLLVKTNINVLGLATTGGAKALSTNYPIANAPVIQNLVNEGAIILASTNMSEFAFSAYNSYSSYGNVRNAYNLNYTPYGSSGGSAVALALSFGAGAIGTDTNSSIRVPAAAAGVVGLRPTIGKLAMKGIIPYDIERDVVGPITKTVTDNQLLYQIMLGNETNQAKQTIKSKDIKIGIINNYYSGIKNASLPVNTITNSEVKALMTKQITNLKTLGFTLVEIDQLITPYYQSIANNTAAGITFCDNFNNYLETTTGPIRNFSQLVSSNQKVYDLTGYNEGCGGNYADHTERDQAKKEYQSYVAQIMTNNDLDILVYPTIKNQNLELGSNSGLKSPGSSLGSVINYPSITVPIGNDKKGFAYGLEFLAPKNQEDLLYQVAIYYENKAELSLAHSNLAPSLYVVPQEVKTLIANYEQQQTESHSFLLFKYKKDYQKLTNDTKRYFKNYAANNNYLADAKKLNERYVALTNNWQFNIKGIFNIFVSIILFIFNSWFIIVLGILGYYILKYYLRKQKSKKRRKRHKKRRYHPKKRKKRYPRKR